ncbi:MAG: molybdopterin-dependent oxidoreductase [Desulfobacteraceae bacterium]|nr:molybdopterin-dependent oxidoreductase [Desulfobacteraceae bacterium]
MKENAKQIKLTIDGREITVEDSLTILEAARQNRIDIPTLCHHPAVSNWGGCRLCVVEVDKSPKLVASCVMPVRAGMEVITQSDAITASRRLTLELLFAERNHNCMFCPQSGDCELQKMAYALQMDHLMVSPSFNAYPTDTTGEYMTLDHNRCILCGRCVRACQEIAGSYVLGFHNRGSKSLIGFDLLEKRENSSCINCGACLQLCPTGAISNRYRTHYAVKGQPVESQTITSVCAACGLLCPTQNKVRDNQVIAIEGLVAAKPNGRPDRGQLCYKGRFEMLKTKGTRMLAPMVKDDQGHWREQNWETALDRITKALGAAKSNGGSEALFGLASSSVCNETLMMFKELMSAGWGAGRVDTIDGQYFRNLAASQDNGAQGLPAETSWKKIAAADMVLVVGADPQQSHPMLVSLLRRAMIERALPIASIGQMESATLFSNHYLAVEDGGLAPALALLAGKIASPAKEGKAKSSLSAQQQAEIDRIARAFISAKSPLILAGQHLTGPDSAGTLQDLFRIARSKEPLTGKSAMISFLKPEGNSMAAWRLGVAARLAKPGKAQAGVLIVDGDPDEVKAALAGLRPAPKFLAVITPYFNSVLAEMAQVMLPSPVWMEEDGSYTSMDGAESVFKPKVLDAPKGVKNTWEILQALGQRIDAPGVGKRWEDIRAKAAQLLAVS